MTSTICSARSTTSPYESSEKGADSSGRWQDAQCEKMIGAISRLKVTLLLLGSAREYQKTAEMIKAIARKRNENRTVRSFNVYLCTRNFTYNTRSQNQRTGCPSRSLTEYKTGSFLKAYYNPEMELLAISKDRRCVLEFTQHLGNLPPRVRCAYHACFF